ncbi:MAG TPA: AAA family ATPase [Nocardioidaceae bacterium]
MWTDVVGRWPESRAVGSFLDGVQRAPDALLLEGEAGIGKTTVWLAAVDQAADRGFRVLTARPSAAEARLSYACLADLLSSVDGSVLESLPRPQRRAIEAALLRSETADYPMDGRATGAAFLSVLEHLSDIAPVVLALDDLQWVDSSSAGAIDFALRRVSSRVGVIATVRSDGDVDPALTIALPAPGRTVRVSLEPLRLRELHTLLRSRLGRSWSRPTLQRIHDISGGNPFYALELARAMPVDDTREPGSPLPRSLGQLVRDRVHGLPVDVQALLLAAAALADPTVERVQRAVDTSPEAVEHLLGIAEKADVVRVDGHRVEFTHPVLATAVYSSASTGELRALHRRLARIVADPEERARHLALAAVRADPETVEALDDAAARARSRGAPATAAELLDLAIRLGATAPERRIRAAQHHFEAGNPLKARATLENLVAGLSRGTARAAALALLATVRLHDDSYQEAAGYLEQALAEAGDDLELRARVLIELLFVLVNLGRISDGLGLVDIAVDAGERLEDPNLLAQALAGAVMTRFLSGAGLDSASLHRALVLEDPDRPTPVMLRPTLIHALLLGWTGDLDEARDVLLRLRQRLLEHGQESDLMFTAFHTVIVECWRGDLAGARVIADDTMERALQLGTDLPLAIALFTQANVDAYAGRPEEARKAARRALEIFERGTCLAVTVWPLVTLGFLDLSLEDYAGAAATLGPLAAAASAMGYGEPTAAPFAGDAVEALVEVGRVEEAARLLDDLELNGRRLDRPWALAVAARGRALLLATQGDLDGAAEAAERALVEHERFTMPFERARTLLVLGQIQRRRRQKRAAATTMGEALDLFEELGMPLWGTRVRRELERVTHSGPTDAGLTPSERRVAELAVTGLRNREVAAALFISPKTVEANLARVYRKLGIHSRAELGRRMTELGA